MTPPPRRIVAIAPVKNEAHIVEAFLNATLRIADAVLLADQGSEDDTVAIARRHPAVTVVENPGRDYDEASRQALLIREARERFGPGNLLLAVDADEFFTPLGGKTVEQVRAELLAHPPGAALRFDKPTLLPDHRHWKTYGPSFPLAYVDDGAAHDGAFIHSRRVPRGPAGDHPVTACAFLHLDLVDTEAHQAKRCYYTCLERANRASSRHIRWRRGHSLLLPGHHGRTAPADPEVLRWLHSIGVRPEDLHRPQPYWWDRETLRLFRLHGARAFAWECVWHRPWDRILAQLRAQGVDGLPEAIPRPGPHVHAAREILVALAKLRHRIAKRLRPKPKP